jgi:rhamnosyltransferase
MKRILFFVHYNKYNGLADYVTYLLEHIKHIYSRVVFISNSPLSAKQQKKLAPFCGDIILRENKGFDFGAWKDALLREDWGTLNQYDSVTLMNDTCFGPLFDMEDVYEDMEKRTVDFWGITNNGKNSKNLIKSKLPEHIQSYFLCFGKKVIASKMFQCFWNNIKYFNNVKSIIHKYEIPLTGILSKAGYSYSVVFDTTKYFNGNDIIAYSQPDMVIKNNVPFLKIKSFIYYKHQHYVIDFIQNKTNYPIKLINNYVTEFFNPNLSLQICDKIIPAKEIVNTISAIKIAIHIHVDNLDVFKKYIQYLDVMPADFDLFITTDFKEEENQILASLKNTNAEEKIKGIISIENREKNISAWPSIAPVLAQYDIAGYFHAQENFIDEWLQDTFELLLKPVNSIINAFQNNHNLGIVIPEIPYHLFPLIPYNETQIYPMLNYLWKKMNCKKDIDFSSLKTIIMSYSTMFWYRPAALNSLFKMHLAKNDFSPEFLADDYSIMHCVECLPVYAAWNAGYDYRIMVFSSPKTSRFIDNMIISEYASTRFTRTYRAGEFVLAFPKFIKKFLSTLKP